MIYNLLSAINFIDWFSFLNISVTAQGVTMPLSEWVAQYACVQTNYVLTFAGIFSIIIMLIKRIKKWWWYMFFVIVTILSITSVGMHTANYGEFQSGVLTTKLVGSYIDMSFTIFMAWAGVCCFIFEFTNKDHKRRYASGITLFMMLVITILTIEVFVFKDRPLFIMGGGAAMDGASGGFSIAEIGCFLVAFPLILIVLLKIKDLDKTEFGLVSFVLVIFVVAAVVSNLYGDNQINSILFGNIHTHSLWHILTGMGTLVVLFWVDYRTLKQIAAGEIAPPKGKRAFTVVKTESGESQKKLSAEEQTLASQKKEVASWVIIIGFLVFYTLLSLIATIIAGVKGARGDYTNYNYNQFQFLITAGIMFACLIILSVFPTIKLVKSVKILKTCNDDRAKDLHT